MKPKKSTKKQCMGKSILAFVPVHEDYRLEKPTGWWPTTIGDEDGCHKGLLREEAAPLPPEQQETK